MGHNVPPFVTDAGHMEIDGKKAENEEFYPNEKDVLSRARQALAMANSMYPLETKSEKASQLTSESNAKSQFTASKYRSVPNCSILLKKYSSTNYTFLFSTESF